MPATYSAVYSAFNNSYKYFKNIDIKTLLDIGAGTGSATWGLSKLINFEKITCIEREESMIKLGKKLMSETYLDKIVNWEQNDVSTSNINKTSDLVVASYMLNELTYENKLNVLEKLWKMTNKVLFIVEPGTPENYSDIMRYKSYIVKQGGYIIAPCPHQNKCELPTDDWCHFEVRIERTKLHKKIKNASSPFEDEKFIYLIACKSNNNVTLPSRILRHPRIEKGYVGLKICTEEGIKLEKITKKQGDTYKKARKLIAGDEFFL